MKVLLLHLTGGHRRSVRLCLFFTWLTLSDCYSFHEGVHYRFHSCLDDAFLTFHVQHVECSRNVVELRAAIQKCAGVGYSLSHYRVSLSLHLEAHADLTSRTELRTTTQGLCLFQTVPVP